MLTSINMSWDHGNRRAGGLVWEMVSRTAGKSHGEHPHPNHIQVGWIGNTEVHRGVNVWFYLSVCVSPADADLSGESVCLSSTTCWDRLHPAPWMTVWKKNPLKGFVSFQSEVIIEAVDHHGEPWVSLPTLLWQPRRNLLHPTKNQPVFSTLPKTYTLTKGTKSTAGFDATL